MDMQQMQGGDESIGQSGYEICIKVTQDGQISVGVESLSDEPQEGGDAEPSESYQQVSSIKEALQVASDIYSNSGQIDSRSDDQQIMDAYKAKAGNSQPKMSMSASRVFGED